MFRLLLFHEEHQKAPFHWCKPGAREKPRGSPEGLGQVRLSFAGMTWSEGVVGQFSRTFFHFLCGGSFEEKHCLRFVQGGKDRRPPTWSVDCV